MAISNLETIIDNIEQMIENVHADNRGRIMLPKDTLRQLLGELKASVPDEIKKFNKKTRELEESKSRELEQARMNAERIMNEANVMRDRLLDENEQVRMAAEKAKQITDDAIAKANDIMQKGEAYARQIQEKSIKEYDDSLAFMLSYIQNIGNDVAGLMNAQLRNLSDKLNSVAQTRNELQQRMQMNNQNPQWG